MDRTKPGTIEILFHCVVSIFAAFLLTQGPGIELRNYVTPWHHDDFAAVGEVVRPRLDVARPVSTSFISYFGRLGEPTYYALFTLVDVVDLALTYLLVVTVLKLRASVRAHAALGFAGAVIWFSESSSVQSLQYLGLVTNSLSYLFGICAALVLIDRGNAGLTVAERPASWALFAALTAASAFAKEDMAPFLLLTAAYSGFVLYRDRQSIGDGLRHFLTAAATAAAIFVASILHSRWVGSPFVGGSGAYGLERLPFNVVENFAFYVTITRVTLATYVGCAVGAIWLLVAAARTAQLRSAAAAAAYFAAGAIALMAPYLILPRHFDYYSMNFFPLLAFAIPPLILDLAGARPGFKTTARTTLAALLVASIGVGSFLGNRARRDSILDWVATARSASRVQIDEVVRAADLGLRNCREIVVQGASTLGPFLMTSSAYLNARLGGSATWVIEPVAKSTLDSWARSRQFTDPRWMYVEAGRDGGRAAACRLSFDPATNRASFRN